MLILKQDEALRRVADRFKGEAADRIYQALNRLSVEFPVNRLTEILESGSEPELRQIAQQIGTELNIDPDRFLATLRQTATTAGEITAAEFGYNFTIQNPAVTRWATEHGAQLIQGLLDETRQAINDIITQSILNGTPPRSTARLIQSVVGLTRRDALSVARYQDGLVETGMKTNDIRRLVQRRSDTLLRRRALTIARTECLPGSTVVNGARATAIYRRWYSGDWVEVITKSGRHIAGTPNHPVLTQRGWKGLGELTKGDRLICDPVDAEQAGASRNVDIQNRPASISEIFDAASAVGVIERHRTRQPDFHGDGTDGYVDVLRPDGVLLIGEFAPVNERRMEGVLAPSLVSAVALYAFSAPFRRDLNVAEGECFTESTMPDSGLVEDAEDNLPVHAQSVRDRLRRSSRLVVSDDSCVVKVVPPVVDFVARSEKEAAGVRSSSAGSSPVDDLPHGFSIPTSVIGYSRLRQAGPVEVDDVGLLVRRQWSGHVFNLSTADGYFAANGVYTGNTMTAANRGQLIAWQDAADLGLFNQTTTFREWITAPDSRACPICVVLDGKRIAFGDEFVSYEQAVTFTDDGERFTVTSTKPLKTPVTTRTPPAHVQCRCTTGLVFE